MTTRPEDMLAVALAAHRCGHCGTRGGEVDHCEAGPIPVLWHQRSCPVLLGVIGGEGEVERFLELAAAAGYAGAAGQYSAAPWAWHRAKAAA